MSLLIEKKFIVKRFLAQDQKYDVFILFLRRQICLLIMNDIKGATRTLVRTTLTQH